jgi:eukaryotic-like serine/threonine-protein kinase
MPIGAGTRVGPYEVTERLGAGGMGEVWRARHLSLKRDDALKFVSDSFAADPEGMARFRREAEILASLNHPNIAQVHGLEEADGTTALVMELVEGQTLSSRIASGPISVDEAVDIARQIARGVEAAHEQGIVHRDLKPANVKVRSDGTVKVLDFGLAKAVELPPVGNDVESDRPTATGPAQMTKAGAVLGTPPYMSPEQARGERVDSRTDIWAFGCVLYEMLTGRRTFDGTSVPDVLAAVIGSTPDWSRLPAAVPPAVRTLLRRCLARDVRHRVRHMSTAVLVLEEQEGLSNTGSEAPGVPMASRSRRASLLVGAAVAGAALTAGVMWLGRRPPPAPVVRTTIAASTLTSGTDCNFALTRDGSRLIYIDRDAARILVRRMDTLDPVPILTTAAYLRGVSPSPDGKWIAFVENSFRLRKVSIAGGPAATVLQMDGPSRGVSWGPDDTIVFATGASDTGIQRVDAGGGPVTVLTRPDHNGGEADHLQPAWLPDGRGVLFTIRPTSGGPDALRVAVLDLRTRSWHTVVEGGYGARYVGQGYLLYAAAGALWAIRFDLSQLKVEGAPVEVLRDGGPGALGAFDVAADGTLAYPRDIPAEYDGVVPVWVDRAGRETPLAVPPAHYLHPRLSPDGGRLAIVPDGELVVWEMSRPWSTVSRMTFSPSIDWFPVWTPDGRRIVYGSWRAGGFSNLYVQEPDSAEVTRLTDSPDMQLPTSITPDGSTLVFHSFMKRVERLAMDRGAGAEPFPLVDTPLEERNAVVSPNGRWLAYEAETATNPGQLDVFVRPFPDVDRGLWQVTTSGGLYPAWCPDCSELFYLRPDGTLVAVPYEVTGSTWRKGIPIDMFKGPYFLRGDGSLGREYDVAPDGRRFLMLKTERSDATGPPHFVIVQRWVEELRRMMKET